MSEHRPAGRPSVSGQSGQTPLRQVRIGDDDYYGAAAKAKAEGLTVSAVIRRLLRAWRQGQIELPD